MTKLANNVARHSRDDARSHVAEAYSWGPTLETASKDGVAFKSSWESKRARALATTGATRLPLLPDVPTIDEQGQAGFDVTSWNGLFAPANTPPEAMPA